MNEAEIIEMIQNTESCTFTIKELGETTIQTKELDFLIRAYLMQNEYRRTIIIQESED